MEIIAIPVAGVQLNRRFRVGGAASCRAPEQCHQKGSVRMSIIERVLEPNSTDTPTCVCGDDMRLAKVEPHGFIDDAETREFDCRCGHRLKLVLWAS